MSLSINKELKNQLESVNLQLREVYNSLRIPGKQELRHHVVKRVGKIGNLGKLSKEQLRERVEGRPIVGVDGSINQTSGPYPHYVALLQALAKSTIGGYEQWKVDTHVPLLKIERQNLESLKAERKDIPLTVLDSRRRDEKLAALELAVALQSARELRPLLIMVDGPLRRYQTRAPELWSEFVQFVVAEEILVVGVIEEIGTYLLSEALKEFFPGLEGQYDRELLFGLLDCGEYLAIDEDKSNRGDLRICFLRPAQNPQAIGIDMLSQQFDQFDFVVNLLYTLTPRDGRGIPIWLDLVDSQVRISPGMLDLLIDTCLDEELKRKLFLPKRRERIY
jgi:hypothetical protein